jgi:hypothetical protein
VSAILNNSWSYVNGQGDFIVIVTDGYYDNFDPQLRGMSPREVGVTQEGTWESLDASVVEKAKIEWCTSQIQEIFVQFLEQQHGNVRFVLSPSGVTDSCRERELIRLLIFVCFLF